MDSTNEGSREPEVASRINRELFPSSRDGEALKPNNLESNDKSSSDNKNIGTTKIKNEQKIVSNRSDQANRSAGQFMSILINGSLESGDFSSVNDIYIKYSIVSGPDWILSSGNDFGITQIARRKQDEEGLGKFVWNHPISLSYRTYNFYGWPQIVLSVYCFDTFGNNQIVGYGVAHLPVTNGFRSNGHQIVDIYCPQSSSYVKQFFSWITGKKPELVNSESFARGDCRNVLQVLHIGRVELKFNIITKDVINNGFNCG